MIQETSSTDAQGRVRLPEAFANATVIIERVGEDELRIRKSRSVPESEVQFPEEQAIVLDDRERLRFLAALDHPPMPNAALHALMAGRGERRG